MQTLFLEPNMYASILHAVYHIKHLPMTRRCLVITYFAEAIIASTHPALVSTHGRSPQISLTSRGPISLTWAHALSAHGHCPRISLTSRGPIMLATLCLSYTGATTSSILLGSSNISNVPANAWLQPMLRQLHSCGPHYVTVLQRCRLYAVQRALG